MKTDIHPQYYPKMKVTCFCGAKYEMGGTLPEMKLEICSNCHPFYTGKEKLIDVAGRVEKFKARKEKASKVVLRKKSEKKAVKKAKKAK